MTREKKEKIDALWRNTDLGKYCELRAKGDEKEIQKFEDKLSAKYAKYAGGWRFYLSYINEENSQKAVSILGTLAEFEEYEREIDKEDPELWYYSLYGMDVLRPAWKILMDKK